MFVLNEAKNEIVNWSVRRKLEKQRDNDDMNVDALLGKGANEGQQMEKIGHKNGMSMEISNTINSKCIAWTSG